MKSSTARQELTGRIIKIALDDFTQKGISAVKMDDIASELSISKRTLYEQFANKESLLMECMKQKHAEDSEYMQQVVTGSDNVLEVIMKFYEMTLMKLRTTNPLFFIEMQKYPRVLQHLEECRESNSAEAIRFFQKGVSQGIFRDDVNFEIVHLLTHEQSNMMRDRKKWEKFGLIDVFNSIILVNMRGISTSKGLKIIDEYIDKIQKNNDTKED